MSRLSRVQHMPLTRFSCACACHFSFLLVKSHTLTTPSPLPLAKCSRELGSLANAYTPSTCPGSKSPRKGCANMRSTLVALRALVYSRARSKGCRLGSRLRVTLTTSEPGACTDAVDRLSALIFILIWCVGRLLRRHSQQSRTFWWVSRFRRRGGGWPTTLHANVTSVIDPAKRLSEHTKSAFCSLTIRTPRPVNPSLTRTTATMKL